MLTMLFDVALAVLLIVTITYCARLSRRIRMLQDSRSELASMIAQFDSATGRAMTSLADLQTVSKRITDALQLKIEKANFLADDLAFLIEKSTKLTTQLEQQAKAQRTTQPLASEHLLRPAFEPATGPQLVKSKAAETVSASSASASLEAVLQRLAASAASGSAATKPAMSQPAAPRAMLRTDAERELLEALKSGR